MTLEYARPDVDADAKQFSLKIKLAIFMFLQYFMWNCWYSSLGAYLGSHNFTGTQIGFAYGAFAIGAMIAPFFVGLIADRYFASEKILGALGILGGIVIATLPSMTEFRTFYPALIVYCALFAPTLALGNSLSLHHLADAKRDFPRVKILSAVGWIAGGQALSFVHGELSPIQFYMAGGASVVFGLFSFTLPHTPPKKVGGNVSVNEVLGLDALALMKRPAFAILVACLFLLCIPIYFYFVNMGQYLTALKWPNFAARMTLAQVSDVIFLFLLPVMLKRLGYKITILIGILSWIARYYLLARSAALESSAQSAMIFTAIALHGVCYDFLFIAGQLYVDEQANERMRGAAQGFIAFVLWGVGAFVGTLVAGIVMDRNKIVAALGETHNWYGVWITPAILSAGVLVVFLICFREGKRMTSMEMPGERGTALDEAPV